MPSVGEVGSSPSAPARASARPLPGNHSDKGGELIQLVEPQNKA